MLKYMFFNCSLQLLAYSRRPKTRDARLELFWFFFLLNCSFDLPLSTPTTCSHYFFPLSLLPTNPTYRLPTNLSATYQPIGYLPTYRLPTNLSATYQPIASCIDTVNQGNWSLSIQWRLKGFVIVAYCKQ